MGHGLLLLIILPLRRFEISAHVRLSSRLRVIFGCLEQSLLRPISSRISSHLVTRVEDQEPIGKTDPKLETERLDITNFVVGSKRSFTK